MEEPVIHQPLHMLIPSVPACIVSVVITQPASLKSCHIPKFYWEHISKQVPSGSIIRIHLSKKSHLPQLLHPPLGKSLTSFLPGKIS